VSTANGHGLVGPETRGKLVQTHKGGRGVEGKPEAPTRHRPLRIEREAGQDPSTRKWHECPEHGCGRDWQRSWKHPGDKLGAHKAATPSDLWEVGRDSGKRSLFLLTDERRNERGNPNEVVLEDLGTRLALRRGSKSGRMHQHNGASSNHRRTTVGP